MNSLYAFAERIEGINKWLATAIFSWGIIVITVVIVIDMVTRFITNTPQVWCHELAMLVFGPYLILGGAYAVITNEHIKMDAFSHNWSAKTKAMIDLILIPATIFVLCVLIYQSTIVSWDSLITWERSGSAWNPPIWPVTMAVPISTFLLILQLIATLVKDCIAAFDLK